MSSTVGNADRWTARFTDAEGTPTDPDGPVTWTVRTLREVVEFTQELGSEGHTGVGVFELVHVPARATIYSVKASAVIDGVAQATAEMERGVAA